MDGFLLYTLFLSEVAKQQNNNINISAGEKLLKRREDTHEDQHLVRWKAAQGSICMYMYACDDNNSSNNNSNSNNINRNVNVNSKNNSIMFHSSNYHVHDHIVVVL